MNFELIEKVKSSIDKFNDAEFYSIAEESVIIKNIKNQSLWKVPIMINENDTLVYQADKAEQVKDGILTEEESFKENSKKLNDIIRGIFCENKSEAISDLKTAINELPSINLSIFESKKEEKYSLPSEGKLEAVKNIYESFAQKIDAYQNQLINFKELGNFFNEENTPKSESIIDPVAIIEAYENKLKSQDIINKSLEKVLNFYEAIKENFSDNVSTFIVENMNLGKADKIKIEAAKIITLAKRQYSEDVSISEDAKRLILCKIRNSLQPYSKHPNTKNL